MSLSSDQELQVRLLEVRERYGFKRWLARSGFFVVIACWALYLFSDSINPSTPQLNPIKPAVAKIEKPRAATPTVIKNWGRPESAFSEQSQTKQAKTERAEVTTKNKPVKRLRLFLNPSESGELFFTPTNTDEFEIGESNGEWTKVIGRVSRPLWVSKQFLKMLDDGYYRVTSNTLNVRTRPSTSRSQIVSKLSSGEQIKATGSIGDWVSFTSNRTLEMWAKTEQVARFQQSKSG